MGYVRGMGKRIRGSGIAIGLSILPVLLALGCGDEPAAERRPRPVRTLVVADALGLQRSPLPGRAKATLEVDLAFEVSGQLMERRLNVGDRVEPGQVLAKLDPRDYENALDAARAERERARAFFERVEKAARTGAVSRQDLTDARARLEQAQSVLNIRQKAMDDTVLVAPFAATVAATYVDNFQNVRAKQPVIRLLDVSTIEVTVDVPESAISLAQWVTKALVEFDAIPGRTFEARVKEIPTEASRVTRTYPVTVAIDPPGDVEILPGMVGTIQAVLDLPPELATVGFEIPMSAIYSPSEEPSQKSFVWVIAGDPPTATRREIETLDSTPRGVRVSGLEPGERIVTAGVHFVRDGQEVRLLD